MKIGILGGSFNPPHFGHFLLSQQLIDLKIVDQVWLMPVFAHVWGKKLAAVRHRLPMCRFLENERIKVSLLEIEQKKALPTLATLKLLEKKYPQHRFHWIIGQKSLSDLPKWQDYEKLIKNYKFLVIPQSQSNQQSAISNQQFQFIHHPLWVTTNLSSSIIRKRVKKGLSLKGFVPDRVGEYIKKHHLYG